MSRGRRSDPIASLSVPSAARLVPYVLILPALLTLLGLFLYPIAWNLHLSLHDVSFQTFHRTWRLVGLDNYQGLFADTIFPRQFDHSIGVSLRFVGGSVAGQFLVGLALALILHTRLRARHLFRVVLVLPWVLSELVVAYIWLYLYQPFGLASTVVSALGLPPPNWLGSERTAIWSLVLTNIWFGTPFTMLMIGSALTTINPETREAALVDGASGWQVFRSITWPLIVPFAALNLILITMWTTNLFALPLAMTRGGPVFATTTTSLYMYRHAFEFGNFSVGAAIGVLLFVFNVVAAGVYLRGLRRNL